MGRCKDVGVGIQHAVFQNKEGGAILLLYCLSLMKIPNKGFFNKNDQKMFCNAA